MDPAIRVSALDFRYPGAGQPVFAGLDFELPRGARCLLVGANGAGKTTLLGLVAGKHMVPDAALSVLGRPAFSDTTLIERVSFIGGSFPLDVDLTVDELLSARPGADPARRDGLLSALGIDRCWRMSRVSGGQRRRVQLLLGLLLPYELLLLDEVTTDLDVVARADLLALLRTETDARGSTVLYATHILDGLERWATHLAFVEGGRIAQFGALDEIHELAELRRSGAPAPLLRLVEGWLRAGRQIAFPISRAHEDLARPRQQG